MRLFDPQMGHDYTQKKRKTTRNLFCLGKFLIRVTVVAEKNKKLFCKKLSGPLPAKPLKLDRHGLAYLKRNKMTIIFCSAQILIRLIVISEKAKNDFAKKFRPPSGQTSQHRSKRITLFEAE